jgi:gliding motility-associated lipoprotein GldH
MKIPRPASFPICVFISLLICSMLTSCDKNVVMESHQSFLNEKWDYSDAKTFTAEIQDTVQHYNIYVTLRHGFNFEWRNLWVKIETTFPDGRKFEKRVNLVLSEANGEWFGDVLGDNCDITIPIQQNAYFPELGKYSFKLTQDMRENPLSYVKSVGMRLEKAKAQVSRR